MAVNARLNGVKITVTDMEASLRFYSNILEMEPPEFNPPATPEHEKFLANMMNIPELHYQEAMFKPQDPPVMIQLMHFRTPASRPKPKDYTYTDIAALRLVFAVEDTAAAYQELKSKGVKFVAPPSIRPPPISGGNVLAFDPDGVAINFRHPGAAKRQAPPGDKRENQRTIRAHLDGVKITVSDMETSLRFYSDILGMAPPELNRQATPDQEKFLAKMMNIPEFHYKEAIFRPQDPPVLIQLMQFRTPASRPKPKDYTLTDIGYVRLVFKVQDTVAAYQELKSKGVRFVAPPSVRPIGGGNVLAYDPDGNVINLTDRK